MYTVGFEDAIEVLDRWLLIVCPGGRPRRARIAKHAAPRPLRQHRALTVFATTARHRPLGIGTLWRTMLAVGQPCSRLPSSI